MEMKGKKINLLTQIVLIVVSLALSAASASAQNGAFSQSANGAGKTDSRMLYHGGPVLTGGQNVYFIFYGCWTSPCGSADYATTITLLCGFITPVLHTPFLT